MGVLAPRETWAAGKPKAPVRPLRGRPAVAARSAGDRALKIVVVGGGGVGKTCMLMSYTSNSFPGEYLPTVSGNLSASVRRGKRTVHLGLHDTAGREDYDRLRPLSYPGADVVLLCYSCISPTSFADVGAKWFPELHHHLPRTPILLVSTKEDLRGDATLLQHLAAAGTMPVTHAQGKALATSLGLSGHATCSALTQQGLQQVFDTAIDIGLA